MSKFPTEVEHAIDISTPIEQIYAHFWNVTSTAKLIPGLLSCKPSGKDTYRFAYEERSQGPISIAVVYTSHYTGNGTDLIEYEGIGAAGDNADVNGTIKLQTQKGQVHVTLRQMLSPELPMPRLLQSLVRPFVERQASDGMKQYLSNVKRSLTGTG